MEEKVVAQCSGLEGALSQQNKAAGTGPLTA